MNEREGLLRRLRVTTLCILGGDEDELMVAELCELPAMRLRCPRCHGSVVAVESKVLWLPDPNVRFDWDADVPRRGRPPKRRAEAINSDMLTIESMTERTTTQP
jgi:hypothetical protein